ncbi:MAG TPA: phosphatase PAP2 family protein [Candidatus Nanoarchaeia archaeon]|nr:phosphatase PAP2 family protein [Candidatus Nanoarchaeia archaeon]
MKKTSSSQKVFFVLFISALGFLVSIRLDSTLKEFFMLHKSTTLDFLLSIITNFGLLAVIMLAIPSILLYKKNRKAVIALLVSSALSIILCSLLKILIQRPRPFLNSYHVTNALDYSFPSLHSAFVFSLLIPLYYFIPKKRYLWVSVAVLASLSRVYFNVHYISDVVFGALLGLLIGIFSVWLYENYPK